MEMTYTPDRALAYNIDSWHADFLISVIGISNVVSRLSFGWLGKNDGIYTFIKT